MKKKLIISFFIILVSFIYGLPNIILSKKLGNNYNPLVISELSPIARDKTYAYAPSVEHILEGNLILSDVFVWEYRNWPSPFIDETIPAYIFALLSKLTGSIQHAFIAGDFIFPPIIFLLFYTLITRFIKNELAAISISFITTIARDFIAVIPYPKATLNYFLVSENQTFFLYLSRAFHPQLTFIFFLSTVIMLMKVIESPQNKRFIIALGLLFGALFYCYIFYWTYFLAYFLIVFLIFIIKKDMPTLKALFLSGLISLLLALYYISTIFQFYQLPLAKDFIEKSSLSHIDLPITLVRYYLILAGFYISTKLKNKDFYIAFLLVLTGLLLPVISKLIIGRDLETFHYLRRAIMPFANIIFFLSIFNLIRGNKRLTLILSIALVVTTLIFSIRTQVQASNLVAPAHQLDQDQQAIFNWLNQNTQKDDVVGSINTFFSRYIPTYTKNKVYFPPIDRTLTTTDEEIKRYIILSHLLGLSPQEQKSYLDIRLLSYMFIYQAYDQNNNLDFNSPKKFQIERAIDQAQINPNFLNKNQFRLDYIVATPQEVAVTNPDLTLFTAVYRRGDYIIFQKIK